MASEFDISQAAASIYADSLLQLAVEAKLAEPIGQELADLATIWKKEPAFAAMMRSAAIDDGARGQSLRKIFAGKLSPLTLNLLLVLNDRHRAMILPAVCDAYRRKLAERMNQQSVYVTTAVPLDDAQRKQLGTEVRRLSGKDAVLFEKVNPDLLGGMTVQIADRLYDTSIRRSLRKLRTELLASVERNLLQGSARFVTEG